VLDAIAELVSSAGYERVTIEAIASAAGVGRQTIYRWWKSKAAIVAEAVLAGRIIIAEPAIPDSGDLRTDLAGWMRELRTATHEGGGGGVLRGLAAAASDSDEYAAGLYAAITAPGRAALIGRLRGAQSAGEVDAGAPLDPAVDALFGTVIFWVLTRSPWTSTDGDALITLLLDGLAAKAREA
jgi:AcrR family transcriptional regulator